ncbi:MAG: hypothetical protein ACMUEM_07030 [Flavobacteriales bacterium AspAUS03]
MDEIYRSSCIAPSREFGGDIYLAQPTGHSKEPLRYVEHHPPYDIAISYEKSIDKPLPKIILIKPTPKKEIEHIEVKNSD